MPKRYSARELIKILKKFGFVKVSQRGSHIKMKGIVAGQLRVVIIPDHKQIATGTLSSILRQANLSKLDLETK